jgi:hypothetical protein
MNLSPTGINKTNLNNGFDNLESDLNLVLKSCPYATNDDDKSFNDVFYNVLKHEKGIKILTVMMKYKTKYGNLTMKQLKSMNFQQYKGIK